MNFKNILFDLDGTLYGNRTGLWDAIKSRIDLFLHEKMGFDDKLIPTIRQEYYTRYGTTLKGLQINYNVNPDEYLEFTHDLPLESYLQKDPSLRSLLESLPQAKWVFTNSDSKHANRILEILGIEGCFQGIIDIYATNFHCKPEEIAFRKAMEIAGINTPSACVFVDDNERNILSAQKMGFFSILINDNQQTQEGIVHQIKTIHNLVTFPELWDNKK